MLSRVVSLASRHVFEKQHPSKCLETLVRPQPCHQGHLIHHLKLLTQVFFSELKSGYFKGEEVMLHPWLGRERQKAEVAKQCLCDIV